MRRHRTAENRAAIAVRGVGGDAVAVAAVGTALIVAESEEENPVTRVRRKPQVRGLQALLRDISRSCFRASRSQNISATQCNQRFRKHTSTTNRKFQRKMQSTRLPRWLRLSPRTSQFLRLAKPSRNEWRNNRKRFTSEPRNLSTLLQPRRTGTVNSDALKM